ncbi:transcription activator-like protein [Rhynchospora pubera]|uniref:Transcription activator-like protein n=1 Tax=Rhynchospora pubera TaxID=906938 RepID=A0AAV8EHE0_9POAL|nr:transcription activator-like protein [Rhynchospora pubera]
MEKYLPEEDNSDRAKNADDREDSTRQPQAPNISELKPVTREAYGGGLYVSEDKTAVNKEGSQPRASTTQSADGPEQRAPKPKHKPPASTGDRDLDITGQSYIQ